MTFSLLPVLILTFVLVSYVALRPFSERVRYLFDFVCFAGATLLLAHYRASPLPGNAAPADAASLWLHAVAGIWWLLGARVLVAVTTFTLNHNRRWREARLFPDLTAAAIYIAAILVVLVSVLALPIGGLIATSGVLAIVLGLALQNTLADVFAGIAFGIESPFNVGDRISVTEKIEGTVVQMNWRSIRILTDGDDVAIVPNSVVAKADIVNRSSPTRVRSAYIELSCPATSNPERVIDTLQQVPMLCPAILAAPPTRAELTRLGSAKNRYKVTFSVADTEHLTATKDLLFRHARRQLYYSGLYFRRAAADGESTGFKMPLLADMVLFESLDAKELAQLAAHLKPRSLEPGEILFSQGETEATMFMVVSGVLQISEHTGTASSRNVGLLAAGDSIGELSLLTGAPYAATATARTHCKLYGLECTVLKPLLAANAGLYIDFDHAARRGLAALNRAALVHAAVDGGQQTLLHRIRAFFDNPS